MWVTFFFISLIECQHLVIWGKKKGEKKNLLLLWLFSQNERWVFKTGEEPTFSPKQIPLISSGKVSHGIRWEPHACHSLPLPCAHHSNRARTLINIATFITIVTRRGYKMESCVSSIHSCHCGQNSKSILLLSEGSTQGFKQRPSLHKYWLLGGVVGALKSEVVI